MISFVAAIENENRKEKKIEKDYFFWYPDWIDILQDRSLPASLYVYIYICGMRVIRQGQ